VHTQMVNFAVPWEPLLESANPLIVEILVHRFSTVLKDHQHRLNEYSFRDDRQSIDSISPMDSNMFMPSSVMEALA